ERLRARWAAQPVETRQADAPYRAWRAEREGRSVVLLAPLTFMNRSGEALAAWGSEHGLERAELLVVVDDVYLPLGELRLRARGHLRRRARAGRVAGGRGGRARGPVGSRAGGRDARRPAVWQAPGRRRDAPPARRDRRAGALPGTGRAREGAGAPPVAGRAR